jgi:hypothetical protein
VSDLLQAARNLVADGCAVVPVPYAQKKPILKEWEKLRLSADDLMRHFNGRGNLGLLNGIPSGNRTDLDLDVPEAVAAAPAFAPPTQLMHGRQSNPASHWWYAVMGTIETRKFQFTEADSDKSTMLVEVRSTGTQTLMPPSVHPEGEVYRYDRHGEPARVTPATLVRAASLVATCALIARHWPGKGSRDDAAMALCGMLLRGGWSVEDTGHFVRTAAICAGDEEAPTRDKSVATQRKLDAHEQVWGAPKLAEVLRDGERVVTTAREWLGLKDTATGDGPLNSSNSFNSYRIEPYPAPLADAAYQGVAGELVRAVAPHTEADPAALLVQLLTAFGNAAGRHAHVLAEADRHYTNLYLCLVGPTAGGRKGTSWGHVRGLVQSIDPDWAAGRVLGGLSSGEGLIHALRDEAPEVTDKRLLAYQPEFAAVLKVLLRDGNLLADTLKQAWDGQTLQVVTKQAPERASNTLVSIIGHITQDELLRHLTTTEAASGFGNRFLWICTRRAQFLPEGGNLASVKLAPLLERLRAALTFAAGMGALARDHAARALWIAEYRGLAEGRPGLLGAMTARAEAQVMRLALLYALIDQSRAIGEVHLRAALAVWTYALASARYIFGAQLGDPTADTILHALRATPAGMTRTEISNLFGRNKGAAELARALGTLQSLGLVRCESEPTEGREAERWYATQR